MLDGDSTKWVLGFCTTALATTGGWLYNGAQNRFKKLEAELALKADDAELNRQRDNIVKLFEKVEEVRATMVQRGEFTSLRDIIIDRLPPRF
jgi:hypothetical protein